MLVALGPAGDRLARRGGHVAGARGGDRRCPWSVLGDAAAAPSPRRRPAAAVPAVPGLHPVLRALLGGAAALQGLALALAHARGVNPDLIAP